MNASNTLLVDGSNEAQRQAWDGEEGNYWADHAGHFDQSMAAYHRHLLAAAALGRSDRDLDEERRMGALDALRRSLSAHDTGRGVLYESAAWTIQAVRKAGA